MKHLSTITAGFVSVLVGVSSSAILVFQAAEAGGATPDQVSSWLMALALGMAATSIGLSWFYRIPIVTAWSTPGAALLATSLLGVPMSQAIGAFLFCGFLICLCGITGWFEKIMDHIPTGISSAMLAGVLLHFSMDVFTAMKTQLVLVLGMFLIFLFFKSRWPRYAVLAVLLVGGAIAFSRGLLHLENFHWALAHPSFVWPEFSLSTFLGVGLPLFVVTMTSQNVTGVAVMRAAGYKPPVSSILTWTGLTTLVIAPFGGFTLNLAAITAAICAGPEAHEDPGQRYVAAIVNGLLYVVVGLFAATVSGLFAAFPKELVLSLAGLALLSPLSNSLAAAMKSEGQRDAAMVTFLITASGLSMFGVGAAFWGLLGGACASVLQIRRQKGLCRQSFQKQV